MSPRMNNTTCGRVRSTHTARATHTHGCGILPVALVLRFADRSIAVIRSFLRYWQATNSDSSLIDHHNHPLLKIIRVMLEHIVQPLSDLIGLWIVQPKDYYTGQGFSADRQQVAKIQIERQQDTLFAPRFGQNFGVRQALESVVTQMTGVVILLSQPRRQPNR